MKNKIYFFLSILLYGAFLSFSSCDYLDIVPVGQVIPQKTTEYRGLINSAYRLVPQHKALLNMRGNQFNPEDDPFGFGLDGFDRFKDIYMWNDLNTDNVKTQEYPYTAFYQTIFHTNEIIANGLQAENDGPENIEQIVGESYALRAYMYFELVNMYAPVYNKTTAATVKTVPVTTEIDIEQTFPRRSLQAVYDLILSDIEKAEKLLKIKKQEGQNKYRFSLQALYALQSRVFLYSQEWEKAIEAAKKALAISNGLEDMNSKEYKANTHYESTEAILALEYVTVLELRDYASISADFLSLYKEGDLRLSKYFADSQFGYKISNKVNNTSERVSFRNSELYLNIAEAFARLGKDAEARENILILLKNRYTPEGFSKEKELINSLSGQQLSDEILQEREKELALEGHQWYDWRRTTQPEIRKTVKGEKCVLKKNDPRYTLQIPKTAREANPLLNE